jgi:6-phosphofructokinase 1
MVVVAEGAELNSYQVADKIRDSLGLDPRVTILGHIQRGGSPTARDRVTATRMGYYAVKCLVEGKSNRVVCLRSGDLQDIDIAEALQMTKSLYPLDHETLLAMLSR